MAGRDLLDAVLGLGPEWKVTKVEQSRKPKELRVELQRTRRSPLRCPHCGEACPGYDTRRRKWRNPDAWGYKTFMVCIVPQVECPEHSVVTIQVPWAEGSSRYTAQFEAEVIGWLKEASVKAVAGRMRLSWNAVDGIMQRSRKGNCPRLSGFHRRRVGDRSAVDGRTVETDRECPRLA